MCKFVNSYHLIVKKIDAQVEISCWNKEKCPQRRQLINLTNYANTAPGDGGSGIKPISIELVFNEPINKIYASDHFGLLSQISVIDVYENNN